MLGASGIIRATSGDEASRPVDDEIESSIECMYGRLDARWPVRIFEKAEQLGLRTHHVRQRSDADQGAHHDIIGGGAPTMRPRAARAV